MTASAIDKLRRLFHTTRLSRSFCVDPALMSAVLDDLDKAIADAAADRLAYYRETLDKSKRPFSDRYSAEVIASQRKEIDRLRDELQKERMRHDRRS